MAANIDQYQYRDPQRWANIGDILEIHRRPIHKKVLLKKRRLCTAHPNDLS